ncbi:hypothetical protein F4777DRAFT_568739 [Nemania sp. FL0916]|nr:hypothetical protein F4777DRAFT_568739 [Nemania sp. FL0916]
MMRYHIFAVAREIVARQRRACNTTISQRLNITASPRTPKRQLLDELGKSAWTTKEQVIHGAPGINAVAILASKEFTSWVEDDNFMTSFLDTLLKSASGLQADCSGLHVLSGVTDALCPHPQSSEVSQGFSVLCGPNDSMLPGLLEGDRFDDTKQDNSASVTFAIDPLVGTTREFDVTVPLANTMFQNGKRSTLYASRWEVSSGGSIDMLTKQSKTIQRIRGASNLANYTSSIIPLLPLTPPRKIVASLGNIVRQVEVDGSPTPASKELEAIIPAIFEERAQREPSTFSSRPIGVWCWVIPRHVKAKIFNNLELFKAGSSQTDADIVQRSMPIFSELLSSGCRLHKILSGGGGWGLKQGLLSLDPETKFSLPDEDNDDLERFIKSFEERKNTEPTNGLAPPGSSLLFCVEPSVADMEALSSQAPMLKKKLTFGVAPNLDHKLDTGSPPGDVKITDGHFGISSAAGLFLQSCPAVSRRGSDKTACGSSQGSFTTKIDVPGAYLYV